MTVDELRRKAAAKGYILRRMCGEKEREGNRLRDRVVRLLRANRGTMSTAELGRMVGWTPVALRYHLDRLERDGQVESCLMPGRGCRSERRWALVMP